MNFGVNSFKNIESDFVAEEFLGEGEGFLLGDEGDAVNNDDRSRGLGVVLQNARAKQVASDKERDRG